MQRKSPEKARISILVLLKLFISLIIVMGILVYSFMARLIFLDSISTVLLLTIFTSMAVAMVAIILILSLILIARAKKVDIQISELKSFKNFLDALHYVATEVEAYEVLYDFIQRMPKVDNVTLYYHIESSAEESSWKKISNLDRPLCSMSNEICPLLKLGHECNVKSIEKDNLCSYQFSEYKKGSYICLSIVDTGYPQSIIQLFSKKDFIFNSANVSKIKSYIEIARPVITSKRALHALNKKASTDKLTKLYNRSFLDPYLENQIEAANLSCQKLSMIIIDIDHFKNINDSLGHAAGDYVLTYFAELILKCVRKSDLVARYGGDEFIVILPSTSTETTETLAERIRLCLSNNMLPPFDGNDMPLITCSLGISTYPVHCRSKDELIKKADIALYKAKNSGRNCMRVYQESSFGK